MTQFFAPPAQNNTFQAPTQTQYTQNPAQEQQRMQQAYAQTQAPQQQHAPPQAVTPQMLAYEMQGLNEASPDSRYPELEAGNHEVQLFEARMKIHQEYGLMIFPEGKVLRSSSIQPGMERCGKISGFRSIARKNYALQDLKAFLIATQADRGLTRDWVGDWVSMAIQISQDPTAFRGKIVWVAVETKISKKPNQRTQQCEPYQVYRWQAPEQGK